MKNHKFHYGICAWNKQSKSISFLTLLVFYLLLITNGAYYTSCRNEIQHRNFSKRNHKLVGIEIILSSTTSNSLEYVLAYLMHYLSLQMTRCWNTVGIFVFSWKGKVVIFALEDFQVEKHISVERTLFWINELQFQIQQNGWIVI